MKIFLTIAIILISNLTFGQSLSEHFAQANAFLSSYVDDNGKVNYAAVKENKVDLEKLVHGITNMDLSNANLSEEKAFSINAYNLMVINSVIEHYPITSVRKIRGFFKNPVQIAGKQTSFDAFEKSLSPIDDPRLHMVLVCAANSCPILLNEAYQPDILEKQINNATQKSLSQAHILTVKNGKAEISKIFEWYPKDFEAMGGPLEFANMYLNTEYGNESISYQPYDWALNDGTFDIVKSYKLAKSTIPEELSTSSTTTTTTPVSSNSKAATVVTAPAINKQETNTSVSSHNTPTSISNNTGGRFIVSSLYDRGGYDVNFFNNYYIESNRSLATNEVQEQSIFFSNLLQFIYGINKRVNVGLDLRFRSVTQDITGEDKPFRALSYANNGKEYTDFGAYTGYSRTGLTAIGPKIKFLPFTSIPSLSIQSTVFIPLISSESNDDIGYIDWTAPTWWTQVFYDHDITSKLSLFTEVDFMVENINESVFLKGDNYSQISTPATMILSYFPNDKATVYLLYNSSPKWNHSKQGDYNISKYDPFSQYGVGYKHFISDKIQAEFIYTRFHSTSLTKTANTFNFGLRYFGTK